MTDKIRWGIFGTGVMARRFAADIGLSQTGALVAVASRTPSKAEQFGDGILGLPTYEALAQSDKVDAIYIATPNAVHADQCVLALNGGKAVLCEKPIATHSDDLRRIMAAAKAAQRICMEGMWTALLPGFRQIAARIDQGDIGRVLHGHASLGFARLEQTGDPITDPQLGGGALLDLGVYCVAALNHLMGAGTLAHGDVTRSASGSIRNATAMMNHVAADGQIAHSTWSVSHDAVLPNRVEITGTKGRIEIDAPFIQMQSARIWHFAAAPYSAAPAEPTRLAALKSSPLWPRLRRTVKAMRGPGGRRIPCDYVGTGLQFQIDEIGNKLKSGDSDTLCHSLEESLNVLTTLDRLADH